MEDSKSTSERSVKVPHTSRNAKRKVKYASSARKEEDGADEVLKVPETEATEDGNGSATGQKRKTASTKVPSTNVEVSISTSVSKPSGSATEHSPIAPSKALATDEPRHKETNNPPSSTGTNDKANDVMSMKPPSSTVIEQTSPSDIQDRDDLSDDTVSIAESSRATRKRKSEKERIDWFLEDADCDNVEPHRVLCARCKNWIELHPKRKYVMKSWLGHKRTCRPSPSIGDQLPPHQSVVLDWVEHESAQIAHPGIEQTTDVDRAEAPQEEELPDSTDDIPRRNSPETEVPLTLPQTPKQESASRSQSPGLSSSYVNGKRSREHDSDDDTSDSPRVVRARTATYTPPAGDGLWYTLTKPFRNFVDGFKQGLGGNTS